MASDAKKVSKDLVVQIANLAMITLSEQEVEKYQQQIESILEYVDQLNEVDTDNISYKSHVDLQNVLREDVVEPSLSQEDALSQRKGTNVNGFFVINSVLPANE